MSEFKLQPIQIQNTQDLRNFMNQLKSWSVAERESTIGDRVEAAEKRGVTASELIAEYGLALKELKLHHRARLPQIFQTQLDQGIAVAEEAASLGSPLLAMKKSK